MWGRLFISATFELIRLCNSSKPPAVEKEGQGVVCLCMCENINEPVYSSCRKKVKNTVASDDKKKTKKKPDKASRMTQKH